jgi:chlorinating enzyme
MLSASQIDHFKTKGWVAVDLYTPDEAATVQECLERNGLIIEETGGQQVMTFYNNVLGLETPRDLHLFHEPLKEMFRKPALVEKLCAIAGPDLLLWYTNVFCKMPGQGIIKWHQAIEYYTSSDIDFDKKTLIYDPDDQQLNLTVWVALDHVDEENGCMRFANGSQARAFEIIPSAAPASEGIFAGISAHKTVWQRGQSYSIGYAFDENEWEVEDVPLTAGQAIIFTERTMHCSYPNNSDRRRLGIIGRYVRPSTLIYPGRLKSEWIDENNHDIRRHFNVLVAGEDRHGKNVVRDHHDLDAVETAFHEAYNLLRCGHVAVPEDHTKLEVMALLRQVFDGDNTESQPNPILHPRQFVEWQAWQQLHGISRADAMARFAKRLAGLPLATGGAKPPAGRPTAGGARRGADSAQIRSWLVAYVADALEMPAGDIDVGVPVERYGLSSSDTVGLMGDMGDWLGIDLDPMLAYDYPTIALLAQHLEGVAAKAT